ncbi:MAG: hypothetical protein M3Q07_07205 [Pseudobdellovibrionaceae bacterium]|nr:hypothetical protein [Pseudobdellovibrionaceae bacterium]
MKLVKILSMAWLIILLVSCQRLANSYSDLDLRCGPDARGTEPYHWVEVFQAGGDKPASAVAASGIKSDGAFARLPVSSKNCVGLLENSDDMDQISVVLRGAAPQGLLLDRRSFLRSGRVYLAKLESSVTKVGCSMGQVVRDHLKLSTEMSEPAAQSRYKIKIQVMKENKAQMTNVEPVNGNSIDMDL